MISHATAYHGTTQGALSITGVPNTDFSRAPDHLGHPLGPRRRLGSPLTNSSSPGGTSIEIEPRSIGTGTARVSSCALGDG